MKGLQQLPKWQTAIQLQRQLVQKKMQGHYPTVFPIRLLHAPTTSEGGPRVDRGDEAAEGVEGVEEDKTREIVKVSGQKIRVGKVGRKWVGQTISRHVYADCSRLLI
jgi:hypothetical protein